MLLLVNLLDNLNRYHRWTFDDQIPRSKTYYELLMDNHTSIMIIPDFDFDVDSGKYECTTTNIFGETTRSIYIDRSLLKLRKQSQQ